MIKYKNIKIIYKGCLNCQKLKKAKIRMPCNCELFQEMDVYVQLSGKNNIVYVGNC